MGLEHISTSMCPPAAGEKEQAFQHMSQQPISTYLYCAKKSGNVTGI